jgi:hypothetical protein
MKPGLKRLARLVEDGARCDGRLPPARRAYQQTSSGSPRWSGPAAPRTHEAVCPPEPLKVPVRRRFIGEESLKFHKIAWIVHSALKLMRRFVHHHNILGVVELSQ